MTDTTPATPAPFRSHGPNLRPPRTDAELAGNEACIVHALAAMIPGYDRIALSYSGGAESGLFLHLFKPLRHCLTVLWVNPGALPHEAEHVRRQAAGGPFVEIPSDREAHWKRAGLPTTLLPTFQAPPLVGDVPIRGPPLAANSACCSIVRSAPGNRWCAESGIGLLIHGQRRGEGSNMFTPGILPPVWGPLAAWTRGEVMRRVAHHGVPLPRQYAEGAPESFECAVCPANLDAGRMAFLRRHYPAEHAETLRLARLVNAEAGAAFKAQTRALVAEEAKAAADAEAGM